MKHSYENFLKRLIERERIPVDEDNWAKMKAALESEGLTKNKEPQMASNRSFPWKTLSMALATLLVGVFIGYSLSSRDTSSDVPMTSTEVGTAETMTSMASTAPSAQTSTYVSGTPSQALLSSASSIPQTQYIYISGIAHDDVVKSIQVAGFQNIPASIKSENIAPYTEPVDRNPRPQITKKFAVNSHKPSVQSLTDSDRDKYNEELKAQLKSEQEQKLYAANEEKINTMNYGLKGGLFAGTGQGGYSGTLHLEGRISDNIMFESDLGIVNSIGSMGNIMPAVSSKNGTANDGLSVNTALGLSPSMIEPGARVVKNTSVSYVFSVFNPSAGYKINDHVTVKMGVDFQTLMSNTDVNTYINLDGRLYRMAKYDFGITPKVNVKLAPKLSSEFVYRNGLNSSLLGTDYWNRNYFFAQLNYNIR